MSIITGQERERLGLDLYNQVNTIREITKDARMSFRDIGLILNKIIEEKIEGSKEEWDDTENNYKQLSPCTQAYNSFSEHKNKITSDNIKLGRVRVS